MVQNRSKEGLMIRSSFHAKMRRIWDGQVKGDRCVKPNALFDLLKRRIKGVNRG